MKTLTEIKADVDQRAAMIGAVRSQFLPTCGRTEDFARPHVETDSRGYHLVVVERGQELSRFTTLALDELLFHIFQTVTFSLACDYELAHRVESQDFRRLVFKRQVELLSLLSESWGRRETDEQRQILRKHPFDDLSSVRARLSAQVGWAKACEQYPLPRTNKETEQDA